MNGWTLYLIILNALTLGLIALTLWYFLIHGRPRPYDEDERSVIDTHRRKDKS